MNNPEKLDLIYKLVAEKGGTTEAVTHEFLGSQYARVMHLKEGAIAAMHVHDYDHVSLYVGHVRLMTSKGEDELKGAGAVFIAKGERHAILAVTDSMWICAHPASEIGEGDEVRIERPNVH